MLYKIEDGVLATLRGDNLTQVHKDLGYKVLDFDIELKEDGTRYDFYLEDGTHNLDKELVNKITNTVVEIKAAIQKALDCLRVEVNGYGYDGNELSTNRMQRAISTLVGDETILWRLYDNTEVTITQTELAKALRASGIKLTDLWFCRSVSSVEDIVKAAPEWWAKYNA